MPDFIATGSAKKDRSVRLWNYDKGKMVARLDHDEEITCLCFLSGHQLLVVSDESGRIFVYSIHDAISEFECLIKFSHYLVDFSKENGIGGETRVFGEVSLAVLASMSGERGGKEGSGIYDNDDEDDNSDGKGCEYDTGLLHRSTLR